MVVLGLVPFVPKLIYCVEATDVMVVIDNAVVAVVVLEVGIFVVGDLV